MIITLMGMPSAGKSFLARKIAQHYGLKHYSLGDIRRKAAADQGMTLAEFNTLGETEDTDTIFDEYQKKLGEKEDDFVIDGRLSAYFIPHAIKVFIDASEDARAQRMLMEDPEHARIGEAAQNVVEAKKLMHARVASDRSRYARHYNYDPYNSASYDILLDTTRLNKEESVQELIKRVEKFEKEHS